MEQTTSEPLADFRTCPLRGKVDALTVFWLGADHRQRHRPLTSPTGAGMRDRMGESIRFGAQIPSVFVGFLAIDSGGQLRHTNAKRQNTGHCDAVGTLARSLASRGRPRGQRINGRRLREEDLRASGQERSRAHPSSPCAAARYARSIVDVDPCMRGRPDPGVHAASPARFMR